MKAVCHSSNHPFLNIETMIQILERATTSVTSEDAKVLYAVRDAIASSPYSPIRHVRVSWDGNAIRLEGSLNMYFHAQVAQEIARQVDGVEKVVNAIRVPASS
jgi:osmotically-inducible protein OsmY